MVVSRIILFSFFLLGINTATAQIQFEDVKITKDSTSYKPIDPLTPAKAAFYSAVIPGLGQVYNKKYWKVPIVYGGLAVGYYFYNDNNKKYKEFRDIYKRRLEGYTDDKYQGVYTDAVLINAQRTFERNRDISTAVMIGFYVLNIIDANVDAHLIQFNVNDNLSLKPDVSRNEIDYKYNVGVTLNYRF